MHNVYDQYAKDTLCALLTPAGAVKTEQEVSADAQRVDLYFAPDAARAGTLGPLGLLGRLAGRPCSLEHFHQPPSPAVLVGCLRKHLNFCHVLSLSSHSHSSDSSERLPTPTVWVLSSGRPTSGLSGLHMQRAKGWPAGCYLAAPVLHFGVVVLNELREVRDTLALRLLGTGATLRRAVAELRRLPPDALEVQVVLPIMLRYRLAVPADPGEQTDEDKEVLMSTQDALGLWEQQVLQRGIEQGRLAEARAALRRVLVRRGLELGAGDQARIEGCRDVGTLNQWLDQALTAVSIDEALR
ncbi:MAG TPA: hypothetical protein VLS89_11415 [Candidatus Nanopelagicales bacterium]|nr:hypothetical protein [Candidatus Nanopelagicales bacterium]